MASACASDFSASLPLSSLSGLSLSLSLLRHYQGHHSHHYFASMSQSQGGPWLCASPARSGASAAVTDAPPVADACALGPVSSRGALNAISALNGPQPLGPLIECQATGSVVASSSPSLVGPQQPSPDAPPEHRATDSCVTSSSRRVTGLGAVGAGSSTGMAHAPAGCRATTSSGAGSACLEVPALGEETPSTGLASPPLLPLSVTEVAVDVGAVDATAAAHDAAAAPALPERMGPSWEVSCDRSSPRTTGSVATIIDAAKLLAAARVPALGGDMPERAPAAGGAAGPVWACRRRACNTGYTADAGPLPAAIACPAAATATAASVTDFATVFFANRPAMVAPTGPFGGASAHVFADRCGVERPPHAPAAGRGLGLHTLDILGDEDVAADGSGVGVVVATFDVDDDDDELLSTAAGWLEPVTSGSWAAARGMSLAQAGRPAGQRPCGVAVRNAEDDCGLGAGTPESLRVYTAMMSDGHASCCSGAMPRRKAANRAVAIDRTRDGTGPRTLDGLAGVPMRKGGAAAVPSTCIGTRTADGFGASFRCVGDSSAWRWPSVSRSSKMPQPPASSLQAAAALEAARRTVAAGGAGIVISGGGDACRVPVANSVSGAPASATATSARHSSRSSSRGSRGSHGSGGGAARRFLSPTSILLDMPRGWEGVVRDVEVALAHEAKAEAAAAAAARRKAGGGAWRRMLQAVGGCLAPPRAREECGY
ncbi:hypothetical protein GPECTOR_21g669 [Gonium pectorale]|uniref:Uncharacterized protein n=1 Tax=Gonium pectorale TaxID=33097 RepID=A0A150GI16_GONPE|nr:hypothetical protein GPECTOR_21g669 [Gonium pectorale]|eukprot:KXZ49443.1 hypothetical protein GPECTOR_21g669 [Gonium pectorale]